MSAAAGGGSAAGGGGQKRRIVVVAQDGAGQELKRLRVPIGGRETVAALKAAVSTRLGGGGATVKTLRGQEDGAELADMDLVEDVVADGEVLTAVVGAASGGAASASIVAAAAASMEVDGALPPASYKLSIKRVGAKEGEQLSVVLPATERTTVAQFKEHIEALQRAKRMAPEQLIPAARMVLSVGANRLTDEQVIEELCARAVPGGGLTVFYLPAQPAAGSGSSSSSSSSSSGSSNQGVRGGTLSVAFTCLDSPEEGPKGTVAVAQDASLFDLKKAIGAAAGLLVEDPPAQEEGQEAEGDEESTKAPAVNPGDITAPPPPAPPAAHGLMKTWRPKVLDFGLGIVDSAGRLFFCYATSAGAKEVGGLARALGIDAAADQPASHHVFLVRFGAEARGADLSEELMYRGGQGRLGCFTAAAAWVPPQCPQQTDRGMATYLSTLYVVTEKLSRKAGADAAARGDKLASHFERLTGCPLAALALCTLLDGKTIGSLEKAALAAATYRLIKRLTATAPSEDAARRDESAFEQTRAAFYYLLALAPQQDKEGADGTAAAAVTGSFQRVSLECSAISSRRLEDPVSVVLPAKAAAEQEQEMQQDGEPAETGGGARGGQERQERVYSRAQVQVLLAEGPGVARVALELPEGTDEAALVLAPDALSAALLLVTPFLKDVNVWLPPAGAPVLAPAPAPLLQVDFLPLAKLAGNLPELAVVRPLSIARARHPALTLDEFGYMAVYLGFAACSNGAGKSTSLFRPLAGPDPVNVDRAEVAAALAKLMEADQGGLFSAVLGKEREPDEAVVILLDTSYSMNDSRFAAAGDEEEDEEGDGMESEDDESESCSDEEDEGDDEEEEEEGLPAFIDAADVEAPLELQCPLTKAIVLDPVVASDGQVYERQAIKRFILEKQHGTHFGYRPGPFDSPVGRGAGTIRPEVELRADDETRRRVEAYFREVYPAYAIPPAEKVEEDESMDAAAAVAPAGTAKTWTLTVRSDILPPKRLEGLSPDASLGALLAHVKAELGLPDELSLTRLTLMAGFSAHGSATDTGSSALRAPLRGLRGFQNNASLKLVVRRPPGLALNALPLVIHLADSISSSDVKALPEASRAGEAMMKPPRYSFIVRGDVPCARVIRFLHGKGKLGRQWDSPRELCLWYDWTYKGDGTWTGRCIYPPTLIADALGRSGQRTVLQVDLFPWGEKPGRKKTSMPKPKPKPKPKPMSRLEVVKHLFESFVNRVDAYDENSVHLGLILFSSKVETALPLTDLLEAFRAKVKHITAKGDTQLFDAVELGAALLRAFKEKHAKAGLRLLVLSDGEDTDSKASGTEAAALCQEAGITLDAILIGGNDNHALRGMAKATGGYAMMPEQLTHALKLMELETMVCSANRPPHTGPPRLKVTSRYMLENTYGRMRLDRCDDLVVPALRLHPRLAEPVRPLAAALAQQQQQQQAAAGGGELSGEGIRRLQKELTALARPGGGHPAFTLYPSDNLSFLRVLLQGPEGSLYATGTWLLYVDFPPTYPLEAPKVRFVTPIKHCNVNPHGRICHSILDRNYTVDTSLFNILSGVFGLLLQPETSDPVDTHLSQLFFKADGSYEAAILAHVKAHAATKSLAQWKAELEGPSSAAQEGQGQQWV